MTRYHQFITIDAFFILCLCVRVVVLGEAWTMAAILGAYFMGLVTGRQRR